MIKIRNAILTGGLLSLIMLCGDAVASTVPTFEPNESIPQPGYPDFWSRNEVYTLKARGTGADRYYTLTGVGRKAVFNFQDSEWNLGNEKVVLRANFDGSGNLIAFAPDSGRELDNSISIVGSLRAGSNGDVSWARQPRQILFSARLTNVEANPDENTVAFGTDSFGGWANQPQFTGGSTEESVWLRAGGKFARLVTALANDDLASYVGNHRVIRFRDVDSITTVPIPAVGWLFASGLGLAFYRRRGKAATC